MRLTTETIKAIDLEEDTFIYIRDSGHFFYVDAIDYFENKVEAIHETDITKDGISTFIMLLEENQEIEILTQNLER